MSHLKCLNVVHFINPSIHDNKLRVLFSYGGLIESYEANDEALLLRVLLLEIDENNELIVNTDLATHIKFSHLYLVEIGSLWRGNQRISTYTPNSQIITRQIFSLDLTKKISSKPLEPLKKENLNFLLKSKKIYISDSIREYAVASQNISLLIDPIQLMEAILPRGRDIRKFLLFRSSVDIVPRYLEYCKRLNEECYAVKKKFRSNPLSNKNLNFLVNLATNKEIQNIFNKIQMSLHDVEYESIRTKTCYRYPLLDLPKGNFSFYADGVWIDEKIFYIFNIIKVNSNPFFQPKYNFYHDI